MIMYVSVFSILATSSIVIFIVFHLTPLSDEEVDQLSQKRRDETISSYFSFNKYEFTVCNDFKKRMNPNGKFYKIDEVLVGFPSVAAALLKYKKHEWIIVAFEKNKMIEYIWLNKGMSRETVSLSLSIEYIAEMAKNDNCTSVLIFHNHPNSDPAYYDCSLPSEQDISSAKLFAKELNSKGINLVEFICEKGIHHQYFSSAATVFFL